MQSVALFFAFRPTAYPIFFGPVPCQPTNENMFVSAKLLLRQLILQLAGKNAGFLDFWVVCFRDVAPKECNLKPANVFPLRRCSGQFSSDAGDGLDISIAADNAFDATTRTHRAGAQYPLPQRRVSESAPANAKHSSAFREKSFAGLDVDLDRSGAGFGVADRGKGKQQANGDEGFHRAHSFCFGSDLRTAFRQYNLG